MCVRSVEWRHPPWLAHRSHVLLAHNYPAALDINIQGDGSSVIAGAGRLSRVLISRDGELKGENAEKSEVEAHGTLRRPEAETETHLLIILSITS